MELVEIKWKFDNLLPCWKERKREGEEESVQSFLLHLVRPWDTSQHRTDVGGVGSHLGPNSLVQHNVFHTWKQESFKIKGYIFKRKISDMITIGNVIKQSDAHVLMYWS